MLIKIGLDAGHGLNTAGKQTPDGIKEWVLNDKVRDKVVALLKDYDVEIIHADNDEGNVDESLASRLAKYKKEGVVAFVSIHHNAFTGSWNNATGVEVFTDKKATSKDTKLAECIYNRLVKYTGLKGRGVKKEDWYVINQSVIPAVLVEGGFMDSNIDYKVITSEAGQNAYAKAVAEGLIEFLGLEKRKVATPTTSTELYRVRKSWKDAASQIGAYKNFDNAKKVCKSGYSVFDSKGNVVYTPETKNTIKAGSTVKLNKGAKTYTGGKIASFVYNRNHKVKEINGQRVVITYLGIVVAAVKLSDLTLVK